MTARLARIGDIKVGSGQPLLLIAGPCVIESEKMCLDVARKIKAVAEALKLPFVFKASYDKANRSSANSFRGPGLDEGLRILGKVKRELDVPVLSDVHETAQAAPAAAVLDVIQIPAFLCRQTDLLIAAGATGRAVNVKKGQFMAPWDMPNVVDKLREAGCSDILLTERGASFGYNRLISDMTAIVEMQKTGWPVIYDATHSVQQPAAQGKSSGGDREMVPTLARAAVAAGADGIFLEVHPDPSNAQSDPATQWPLKELKGLLRVLAGIREVVCPPSPGGRGSG